MLSAGEAVYPVGEAVYPVFRHDLSDELKSLVVPFARRYATLDGPRFRALWAGFIEEHAAVLEREDVRLEGAGRSRGAAAKAYRSARYYYRNRGGTERRYPSLRKPAMPLSAALAAAIEAHAATADPSTPPKVLYIAFLKANRVLAADELDVLVRCGEAATAEEAERRLRTLCRNRWWRWRRRAAAKLAA